MQPALRSGVRHGRRSTCAHQVRDKSARALAANPLPVRSHAGSDPRALVMIASAVVADRELHFGILPHHPRLWVVFADHDPPILVTSRA